MAKVKVQLHLAAFRELRFSPGVKSDLAARASRVAAAAGGMAHDVTNGRTRARGTVWTDTTAARLAEANHAALTRAVDAGR